MTTISDRPDLVPAPEERPAPDVPDALIKEARRLRRRRYLLIGAVLAVVAATTAGLALSQGGGRGHTGDVRPRTAPTAPAVVPPLTPARSPGTVLPKSALFTQVSVTPHGLLLTGETPAAANSPAGSVSGCVAAPLNPQSLAVGKPTVGNCNDPLLFGENVEVVNTPVTQSNNGTISINTANPATGQVNDGPVVMTYGSFSDTRPVIA